MIDKAFVKANPLFEVVGFRDTQTRMHYRLFDPVSDELSAYSLSKTEALDLAYGKPIELIDLPALRERDRLRYQDAHVAAAAGRCAKWIEKHAAYSRYINESPEWRDRRARIMNRDNYTCQAILPGCTGAAKHIHHKTYEHVGREPAFDLVAVCTRCHASLHELGMTHANPT